MTISGTAGVGAASKGMRRLLSAVLLALGGLVAASATTPCQACSCAPLTPAEAVARVDTVFVGTVVAKGQPVRSTEGVMSSSNLVPYRVEVDTVLKGEGVSTREEVLSPVSDASCGVALRVGERYVFLPGREGEGWQVRLCDGSGPAREVLAGIERVTGPGHLPSPAAERPTPVAAPGDVGDGAGERWAPTLVLGALPLLVTLVVVGGLLRARARRRSL